MIRLRNGTLARLLHAHLYKRMLSFAQQYSPELPGEYLIESWLTRLYANDENLHILIELQEHPVLDIIEHAVIDTYSYGEMKVIVVHQNQHTVQSLEHLREGIEYVDKLAASVNARCAFFYANEHLKAYEHKFGYTPVKTLMMKKYYDT